MASDPAVKTSPRPSRRGHCARRLTACLVSGAAHLGALTAFAVLRPLPDALPSLAGDDSVLSVQMLTSQEPVGQPAEDARELEAKVVVMPQGAQVAARHYVRFTHHLPPRPRPTEPAQPEPSPGQTTLAPPATPDDHAPIAPQPALPRATVGGNISAAWESSAASQSAGTDPDSLPELLDNLPPQYPEEALRRGWQGTVSLRLRISRQGRVVALTIAESSGAAVLDAAAASAVKHWRFRPATQRGQPTEATVRLPVVFELQ